MPIHLLINPGGGNNIDKRRFLRLTIHLDKESIIYVSLNIFLVRFAWYPLQKITRKPVAKMALKISSGIGRMNWKRLKFLVRVSWLYIKKSKLKRLFLDVDTGNVIINANLYPFFELMSAKPQINLNINYAGNFALVLDLENNLWNAIRIVIWNWLKRSFKFTKN